jgi:ribose 5-phosphate isomerase B
MGGDHAGFDLKEQIENYLKNKGLTVHDLGNIKYDEKDDYPDFGKPVADAIAANPHARGILLCGNAEGICIVANKIDGARAAIGYSLEATTQARNDDDVNIVCLPGRLMSFEEAVPIVDAFLNTPFEGAERQKRRIEKINEIEKDN